ncbi:DoxX family protein [Streptomyces sp. NBC_01136]|uniref:DoxX family protein n=1 Tax=unclassified Streptomyces TaxID=2593676 RepID=UPI0032497066|nr:DoxX family protein [Streptomyces sp. NBC_01136]WST81157.1 DoxX family protein [Streptomyces sp. NBC_01136]
MTGNYITLTVVLSLGLIGSAWAKLTRQERTVASLRAAGVPDGWLPRLALLEMAGAVGLCAGFAWRPLGVAAAGGVVLYFAGALVFHGRAGDYKGTPAPAALLLAAVIAGLLALSTA